jgi:predicted dehydrogenase
VSIDCGAREAEMYRLVRSTEGGRPRINGGPIAVVDAEPLRTELEDFVSAVRDGRQPGVPGADGRRAVDLAQQITARMRNNVSV